jgi:hypothetical protein
MHLDFGNSLNEAKTTDARLRAVAWMRQIFVFALYAGAPCYFFRSLGLWAVPPFIIAFAFPIADILRQPNVPVRRRELVAFALTCCAFVLMVTPIAVGDHMLRMNDSMADLVKVVGKIASQLAK